MQVLKKSLNKIKINIKIIIAAALLLLCAVTLVYAYFSNQDSLNFDYLKGGNLDFDFNGQSVSSDVFKYPGNTYETALTVVNTGDCAFTYGFEFTLTVPQSGGMEMAVLCYLDGKYYGTLHDLASGDGASSQTVGGSVVYVFTLPFEMPLYMENQANHNLKLEYHIGGIYFNDKYFDLEIGCKAKSLDKQSTDYIYAEGYQLGRVLSRFESYSGKRIILSGNCILNENTVIEYGADIDLNGYTLNLNGKTLTYDFDCVGQFKIFSGKSGGKVSGGNIQVDAPNGVVLNSGAIFENVNFTVIDSGFIDIFIDSINKQISGGIAETFDYLGDFADYIDFYYQYDENLPFASSSNDSAAYFDGSFLNVISPESNQDIYLTFNFNKALLSETVSARVLGEAESIISRIETANNLTFASSDSENRFIVTGDLFLPVTDKLYESSVIWISSQNDVLTGGGKFTKPYKDTEFELSAVYAINGKNIMVTYYFTAQSKTIQEKIDEVANIFGSVVFVEFSEQAATVLPRLQDYQDMDFTAFEFSVLAIDSNILTVFEAEGDYKINLLNSIEQEYSTYITIKGYIGEQSAQSSIGVYVDIIKNISIFDAAHRYVKTHLNHITDHTYNGFDLPSYYIDDNTVITYEIFDGENSIENTQTVHYTNPDNVTDYVGVYDGNPHVQPATNGGVNIDRENVPVSNTPVYIEVTVENGGQTDTRLIDFGITGLLHYGEDIEDITLFHLLRRVCDSDFDWYISADEAQSITALPAQWIGKDKTVSFEEKSIGSVLGLEYFINLQSINLNSNNISDLSPLSQLYSLKELSLSGNGIIDVSPLAMLMSLEELDLSNNNIDDISGIKNLKSLITLNLSYNRYLSSFQALEGYETLKELNLFETDGINNSAMERMNLTYLISAYDRATEKFLINDIIYYTTSGSKKWLPDNPNDIDANRILSSVSGIYQFSDVLYLPFNVWYNNTLYAISWSAEGFEDIIQIDAASHRAYITQPSSSVDVKIYASILYGSPNPRMYYRAFDILSKHDENYESVLKIETENGDFVNVYDEDEGDIIEDDTLRYYLFKHFDTGDGIITQAEIAAKSSDALMLGGLGIKSIKGLQYFNGIQTLDLKNNFIDDISYLSGIDTLKELYLSGGEFDFSALSQMNNLMILNVYGSKNLNSTDALSDLFTVYENNRANQIKIYKDSYLESELWNPYRESAAMALKGIQSIYPLSYNETYNLQKEAVINLYDGNSYNVSIEYTKPANMTYTLSTDLDLNQEQITASQISAADRYEILNATVTYESVSVTARLTVVIKAVTDVLVEWHDQSYENLFEVVKNSKLRQFLLSSFYQENADITRAQLSGVTSLNFEYENDGLGLRNLELFYGLNLQELNISYYSPQSLGEDGLTFLDSDTDKFAALKNLSFAYSVVDIYGLQNIKGNLESLSAENCAYVKLYGGGEVFGGFYDLTSLVMTNCGITDFTAIKELSGENYSGITYLEIYGNPSSASYFTDACINVLYNKLGANPIYEYYVAANNVLWIPQDNSYLSSTITDLNVIIDDLTDEYDASYGAYNPNYDILGGYKILLPVYINLKGVDYDIDWSSTAPQTIDTDIAAVGGVKECAVTAQALKAFVVIEGVVTDFNKSIKYVFVVDANKNLTADDGSFDIEQEFMSGGEFYDPVFAYRALSLVGDNDEDGVFYVSDILNVTSMQLQNADNLVIQDITGISNFENLTTLRLNNNAITDITELYHLENLTDLRLNGNTINTLYYDQTENIGIFDNMDNLQILHLQDCYSITDFMPVAQRNDDNALAKLRILYIYCGTNNIYIDNYNKYAAVKVWWEKRKYADGQTDLYLFRNDLLKENATLTQISDTIERLNALDNVNDQISSTTPFNLDGTVTYEGNSYFLKWEFYGDVANVMTLEGNTVQAFTAESQKTNHKIPMLVYIDYYVGTVQHKVGKVVYLNLQHLPEPQELPPSIQLSYQEYLRYDAQYTYEKNGNYYVLARHAVPDGMLMNCLFNHFNRTTVDNIIDIDERDNPYNTSFNVSNRGITDITGIELFPKLKKIYFSNNKIAKLPDLPISEDSEVNEIGLNNNYFLYDITLLNNENLRNNIETLYLNNCYNINQQQLEYLKNMSFAYLTISGVNYHNIDFIRDMQLTRISVSNNFRINSNGNLEVLHTFYLRRNYLRDAEGISSQIFENYIKLHEDYPDVITEPQTPLPDSFEMYGEMYGIVWSKVDGEPYTIDYDEVNDKYKITLDDIVGDSVRIYARAVYNGTQTYRQIITLRTESVTAAVPYVSDADYDGGLLSDIMPDEVLRYFVIAAADTDADGEITAAEADNFTELNINSSVANTAQLRQAVQSFEGIQHFTSIETLDINFCGAVDFCPIEALVDLQELSIKNNLRAVNDFDFMLPLQKLTTLTLSGTLYSNLSFIADLPLLETLAGISAAGSQDGVLFVKSALAYARLAGSLKESGADMGGVLAEHISTADEKEAAFILDSIQAGFITDKGIIGLNAGEYGLPSSVSYLNEQIDIHWVSLSGILDIVGYTLTAAENNYYSSGGIACYITYNGALYYRYWQVTVL